MAENLQSHPESKENEVMITFGDVLKGGAPNGRLAVVTEITAKGVQAGAVLEDQQGNEMISGAGTVSGRFISVVDRWEEERVIKAMARFYLQDEPNPSREDREVFEQIARNCAERSKQVGSITYQLPGVQE